MSTFPYPLLSTESTQSVFDSVRGMRRYRYDASGKIAEVSLADGSHIQLSRDHAGQLREFSSADGFHLQFEPIDNAAEGWRASTTDRVTEIRIARKGRKVALDIGEGNFQIECDSQGRYASVRLPGSQNELTYEWRGADRCVVHCGTNATYLQLTRKADYTRHDWDDGCWIERASPGKLSRTILDSRGRILLEGSDEFDSLWRPRSRAWSDGWRETFARDRSNRLTRWTRRGQSDEDVCYEYGPTGLIRESTHAGVRAFDLDAAGRVLALTEPDGTIVEHTYDLNGRRVRSRSHRGETRYGYDVLGQLLRIDQAGGCRADYAYDALGRRVETRWNAPNGSPSIRTEHRDLQGRLWCVTDECGRTLHCFIWLEGRVVGRVDGALGDPLAEVFLSDHLGTLLGVVRNRRHGSLVDLERPAPFGAVSHSVRPSLYGHFGDPRTQLIHFGARDYDVISRSFLSPDPYHGGPDDPRLWGGASARQLAIHDEIPRSGIHAYALCQFDPTGRADFDGHRSVGVSLLWGLFNFFMTPTWGWPLTSISLFFFLPLDIYFEFFGRLIQLGRLIGDNPNDRRPPNYSTFPWPNHSIFGLRGMLGSARQGHLAFALNGFLPRVISGGGLDGDRAVTIGHVVWINRNELNVLARPQALAVWDIDGGAAPATKAFNADPGKDSVLAVLGISPEGKKQVHVSFWGRAFGNRIVNVGGIDGFADQPEGGIKPGFIHLAKVLPLSLPFAANAKSKDKTEVHEFLYDPGTSKRATAELDTKVAFALRTNKRRNLEPNQRLEISFGDDPPHDPVYALVADVTEDAESASSRFTILLYQGFPATVTGPGGPNLENLTARRIVADPDRAKVDQFTAVGASTTILQKVVGGDPPELYKDDVVLVKAGVKGAPFVSLLPAAPPDNDTIGARIKKLTLTVKLTAALDPGLGNTDVLLLHLAGPSFTGKVIDATKPNEIKFEGPEPGFDVNTLVEITHLASSGKTRAKVESYNQRLLKVTPLAAALAPAKNDLVTVQALLPSEEAADQAAASNPSGASPSIEVQRSAPFKKEAILLFRTGATQQIRVIDATERVQVELSADVVGGAPFEIQPAKRDGDFGSITGIRRSPLMRFLKFIGGTSPTAFKSFPDSVLGLITNHSLLDIPRWFPVLGEFYIRSSDPTLDESFRMRWRPLTFDGSEYFVLDRDLPLFEEKNDAGVKAAFWYYDRDEPSKTELITPAPAVYTFEIREFDRSGAERKDTGARRVLALEPEVIVPEDPQVCYTHHDSLIEHELHHAVQNNRYGPFMGAFPLTGLLSDALDFAIAGGADPNSDAMRWLHASFPDPGASGFKRYEIISVGGLMTVVWKYVILGPFLLGGTISAESGGSDDIQQAILDLDFNDLNQVFNPIWGNLIKHYPRPKPKDPSPIDPSDPFSKDVGEAVLEWIVRAMDLRSWVPFLGMVPTWLGDSARNFVEQQASRASGDLYSTILSANDRFNHAKRLFPDSFNANLKSPIGQLIRMMVFPGSRNERMLRKTHANRPGLPFAYQALFFEESAVLIQSTSGAVLLHPQLFQKGPAAPVPGTHKLEGPDGSTVDFLVVAANDQFIPAIRALLPIPPKVNRSGGFYFAPVSPGTYHLSSFATAADIPAKTHEVTLTIQDGKVTFGGEEVPYAQPPAHPSLPAHKLQRFLTETAELLVDDQARALFKVTTTGVPPALLAVVDSEKGWKFEVAKALPAGAGPHIARVRIYRFLKKNDSANAANNDPQFDLYYGDEVPSLKGIRSYLDNDLWFPVRDFILEIKDLPPLASPVNMKSDEKKDLDLPLKVDDPSKVRIQFDIASPPPRALPNPEPIPVLEKHLVGPSTNPAHPRGELWQIGPLPKPLEDPAGYNVEVEYGTGARSVKQTSKFIVEPVIRLTAPGPFRATVAQPLVMDITGGTAPYRAEADGLPDAVALRMDGSKVHVELTPAGPDIDPERKFVVIVTDSSGKRGRRTMGIFRKQ
jgi:YD repeat-containing protein